MTIKTTANYGIAYADADTALGDYPTVTQQVAASLDAAMGRAGYTPPDATSFAAEVAARVAGDNALKVLQATEANIKTSTSGRTVGDRAFATDTKAVGVWDGARWLLYDSTWQTYTPEMISGVPIVALGNGVLTGRFYRKGREVSVEFLFRVGTSGTNIGAGTVFIGTPPGYRPASTTGDATYSTYCGAGRASGASGVLVCTVALSADASNSTNRRMCLVNSGDVTIQAGGGPTSIAASGTFVQGRATYLTNFES